MAWLTGQSHPLHTVERLTEAVRKMEADTVDQCLAAGASVQGSINRQGQTILDLFVVEHAAMIESALEHKGSPQDVTRQYVEQQEAAFQVMRSLVDKGAVLSAGTAVLKPGLR
mmetsp:Transcript_135115/g.320320  ORF Transcript_135115/g.320320 Transcript_135115/m.320320 type:complete len:113 (+) Transcript_135115:38-376(+)|eukprot:CAMPEP_0181448210 /NCGR_PEP_ID=MMETSP1110-20121109/27022_1 /TAXON_ID=174948 /ORGANISM="Symbiodinium sp., Strain CCMP421" /LENGTH=112 /DNA_ID=CAMNT_0023572351 /DNA_START=48 /DNA_END=386 /DNA_ORIENTATION=-